MVKAVTDGPHQQILFSPNTNHKMPTETLLTVTVILLLIIILMFA